MSGNLVRKALKSTLEGGGNLERNYEIPDECPICHKACAPTVLRVHCPRRSEDAQIAFLCPNAKCGRVFVAQYSWVQTRSLYILMKTEPVYPQTKAFPQEIEDVSPGFTKLYNQAQAAEAYGLEDICGVGYRKALEFLIKDYLIQQHSDEQADIKSEFLGTCIRTRVQESRVKQCAERAAWLGNDETHYERRWSGKDLEDLKMLIDLTVHWVSSELLTESYFESMQSP